MYFLYTRYLGLCGFENYFESFSHTETLSQLKHRSTKKKKKRKSGEDGIPAF